MQEKLQYLDDLQASLARALRHGWRLHAQALTGLHGRLRRVRPSAALAERRREIRELQRRLFDRTRSGLKETRASIDSLAARLRLLSPENVLARGYSITTDEATGRILRDARDARRGQRLKTRLQSGAVRSVVVEE